MAHILKTRGIIIGRRVYGEADRILTILTPGKGKIQAIAKGSRKMSSKLGGNLELFYVVDWMLAEGKTWYIVSGAETVNTFSLIGKRLDLFHMASYVCKLVSTLVLEEENSQVIYELLTSTIRSIANNDSSLVLRQFEWQMMFALGYKVELQVCVQCRRDLNIDKLALLASAGGLLCLACQGQNGSCLKVDRDTIKVLRLFERANRVLAPSLSLSEKVTVELEQVTRAFLEYHLEHEFARIPIQNFQLQK